jgi:hypothetical protein
MSNRGRVMRSASNAVLVDVEARPAHQARIFTLPPPERSLPERPSKVGAFGTLLAIGMGIGAVVGIASAIVRVFVLS